MSFDTSAMLQYMLYWRFLSWLRASDCHVGGVLSTHLLNSLRYCSFSSSTSLLPCYVSHNRCIVRAQNCSILHLANHCISICFAARSVETNQFASTVLLIVVIVSSDIFLGRTIVASNNALATSLVETQSSLKTYKQVLKTKDDNNWTGSDPTTATIPEENQASGPLVKLYNAESMTHGTDELN